MPYTSKFSKNIVPKKGHGIIGYIEIRYVHIAHQIFLLCRKEVVSRGRLWLNSLHLAQVTGNDDLLHWLGLQK